MGKDTERSVARKMYVEDGKTAVEISRATKVTEKTIGIWVDKYGWKSERNARLVGKSTRLENLQRVIDDIIEQRLALSDQIKAANDAGDKEMGYALNRQAVALGDELSKYNKAKDDLIRGTRIPLSTYLEIMGQVFEALRKQDEKLHNQTLDFQENHVQDICKRLG